MNINLEKDEISLLRHRINNKVTQCEDIIWYKRKRYYVALLACCGMCTAVVLNINFSIALVEMTSFKYITMGNRTFVREPEFKWNSVEKGIILSSFSWGYAFSFLGGILTSKFGGTRVFGLAVAVTGLLTLLTPVLIRLNIVVYLVARICEGFAEGLSMAALMEFFLYWMSPHERSRLSAIVHSGMYLGPGMAYFLCGLVIQLHGWEAAFFVTGGISIVWFLLWWIFTSRSPATDTFISKTEKEFMNKQIKISPPKKLKYPWRKMFTSAPLWAYLNERFVHGWSLSFVYVCLPMYVKDMLNVNIDSIGYISSLPHLSAVIGMIVAACFVDYYRNEQIWSISAIHKVLIAITQITCIILLIIMILWTNFTVNIICICLFKTVYSLATVCYNLLPNDMAPHYSSLINGMAISAVGIGLILNPIIQGLIVSNHMAVEWSRYFIFLSSFNIWGAVIFSIFGSGELQPWAIPENATLRENVNEQTNDIRMSRNERLNDD